MSGNGAQERSAVSVTSRNGTIHTTFCTRSIDAHRNVPEHVFTRKHAPSLCLFQTPISTVEERAIAQTYPP